MGSYAQASEYYDPLYSEFKDYRAEARKLVEIFGRARLSVRRALDVGCGTGRHAEALGCAGVLVDGIDVEPDSGMDTSRCSQLNRTTSWYAACHAAPSPGGCRGPSSST